MKLKLSVHNIDTIGFNSFICHGYECWFIFISQYSRLKIRKSCHSFEWEQYLKKKNKTKKQTTRKSCRNGSLTSRGSDESKSRRVFGSLLRRHTSFGATESSRVSSTQSIVPASPQENTEWNLTNPISALKYILCLANYY